MTIEKIITQFHYLLCHTLVHFLQGGVRGSACASLGWLPGRTPRSFPGWEGHPGSDRFGHGCHWSAEKLPWQQPRAQQQLHLSESPWERDNWRQDHEGVEVPVREAGWPQSLASWAWFQSTETSETVRHNSRYTTTLHTFKGKGQRITGLQGTYFKNLWCFQRNSGWQSISASTSFIQGK